MHPPRRARSRTYVLACARHIASRRPGRPQPWSSRLGCMRACLNARPRLARRAAAGVPQVSRYAARMRTRPDVLVLGGGGSLGEAWMMGVLAGIEDAAGFDLRECESFVGTSAGAIVAAHLVAGRSPRRPSAVGTELELGLTHAGRGLGGGGDRRRPACRFVRARGRFDIRAARARRRRSRWCRAPLAAAAGPPPTVRHARPTASPRCKSLRRASTDGCGSPRSTAARAAESCSAAPARRRRPSPRPSKRHARCRGCSRRSRSAAASTWTAASGARPTSMQRRPGATLTSCA